MPLTLPTLAALIPDDINADVVCIDEGIADVDLNLQADLIGMTVITGTANRTYELSRHFRDHGITVILGGPHVTLVPDDAQPHADSIVVGYAEQEWPRLFRDFVAGELRPRYNQSPDLDLSGCPHPDRSVLPGHRYITSHVPRLRSDARVRAQLFVLRRARRVGTQAAAETRGRNRR